uniref:Uncharacterized protein n=1 Tax=Avena sativa TaxID=4498 RepID=A0ACD5UU74_AVESA
MPFKCHLHPYPYPPYATDGMAGGSNYGSQLHHHGSHEDSFLDGLLTAEYTSISAGATSLSHMGAPARSSPAATKQLLPPSSPTLFNWLNESTVRILPPADMAGVADNPVNTMSAFNLGTSLPPEASGAAASAFQHPVQISGVNWNP